MEILEGNEIATETLSRVSFPADDSQKTQKPSSEGPHGDGFVRVPGTQSECLNGETIPQVKEGFECKKMEENEGESDGLFGNFTDGAAEKKVKTGGNGVPLVVVEVTGSLGGENGGESEPVSNNDSGEKPSEIDVNSGYREVSPETGVVVGGKTVETEAENDGEEEEEESDHGFVVGDFVWGKIKSHPWWPGRIHDPLDASVAADKVRGGNRRVLVAYFGDGSFSWCGPSQLRPFSDHFEEMSKQSNSKNFVTAVQAALAEVGWLVEAEFSVDPVERPRATNSGIRGAVRVPIGNTIKTLVDQMEPLEVLSVLKVSATLEWSSQTLELTVLRGFLAAFYRSKGGCVLAAYDDPKCIVGLEDKARNGVVGDVEVIGPVADKPREMRKQKSVAELLGGRGAADNESGRKKANTANEGAKSITTKRERKKEAVGSRSPETGAAEEEEEMTTSRKRKKSKYLSPPYTTPIWGVRSPKAVKLDVEEDPETGTDPSPPPSAAKNTRREKSLDGGRPDSQEHNAPVDATVVSVSVIDVVQGLLHVAQNLSCQIRKKSLATVAQFVSSFRSFRFKEGPEPEPVSDRKWKRRSKKDGPEPEPASDQKKNRRPKKERLMPEPEPKLDRPEPEPASDRKRKRRPKKDGPEPEPESEPKQDGPEPAPASDRKRKRRPKKDGPEPEPTSDRQRKRGRKEDDAAGSNPPPPATLGARKKPVGRRRVKLRSLPLPENVAGGESEVGFVRKKLEVLSSMVAGCEDGEMDAEMKAKLGAGIKDLLEKVSNVG